MSVPQQLHGQSPVPFQLQDSSALKGGDVDPTPVKFDVRNVTKHSVSNYLLALGDKETKELAIEACNASKTLQGDQWNKSNLVKDLKNHELPRDFNHRSGCKEDKRSAVLNLFKGVQVEAINAEEGDDLPKAEKLKSFLQDPASVFVGGRTLFFQKMVEYEAKKGLPQAGNGGLTQGSHGVKEPGMPPAENPFYEGSQKRLFPLEGDIGSTAFAPPNYEISQTDSVNDDLTRLESRIRLLSENNPEEVPRIRSELERIDRCALPQICLDRLREIKARFEEFQRKQRVGYEIIQIEQYHDEIDVFEKSFKSIDKDTEHSLEVKRLERKIDNFSKQKIDRLTSVGETQQGLKARVQELREHIMQWYKCVSAQQKIEILESGLSELNKYKHQKSKKDVDSLSVELSKLSKQIGGLPSGEHRNKYMERVSELETELKEAQEQVVNHQVNEALTAAEKIIVALECDATAIPEPKYMTRVRETLDSTMSLLVAFSSDEALEKRGNLQERFKALQDRVANGQGAASKTTPLNQSQGEVTVNNVKKAFASAEALISTLENDPNPPGERHLTEADTCLNGAKDQLTKLAGREFETARDELQTTYKKLAQRLNELKVRATGAGQSKAEKMQAAGQSESESIINKINSAFDSAESVIRALESDPNDPEKKYLATAKASLKEAKDLLVNLSDPALASQRASLEPRLSNLSGRLNSLEVRANQGQMNTARVNSDDLLQKGVEEFGRQMTRFGDSGDVSKAGFQAAASNMSELLSHFAGSAAPESPAGGVHHRLVGQHAAQTVQSRQSMNPQGVQHSSVKQNTNQRTEPQTTKIALTPGASLAKFAGVLGIKNVDVFRGDFSSASIGFQASSERIKPIVTSTEIPFRNLPRDVQERMMKAGKVVRPEVMPDNIKLVQVYAFAPDQKDFEGASFQVKFESVMTHDHHKMYTHSRAGDKYIPMEAELRMPMDVKQSAEFYATHWALHKSRFRENVMSFAHGAGEQSHAYKHDIGFSLVAPVLKALGADAKTAMSKEAGFGIPFGLDLKKQSRYVLETLMNQKLQRDRGYDMYDGGYLEVDGFELGSDVVTDGPVSSSGINPVALERVSEYHAAEGKRAEDKLAKVVGILWVQTITGLPGIKNVDGLMNWVEQDSRVDRGNPRLPTLL